MEAHEMVSGKWYKVNYGGDMWILKFCRIYRNNIHTDHSAIGNSRYDEPDSSWGGINSCESIEPATREEVLHYYPDEKLDEINNTYQIY